MKELRVYPYHIQAAGFCLRGAKQWAKTHNVDWRTFVLEGVSAEVLLRVGDPFTVAVVNLAEQEAKRKNNG